MFESPPSPLWQWIGLAAGLLGFGLAIVALPTVFQMLLGAPKIDIDSERYVVGSRTQLRFDISQPLVARWARWLKVRRSPIEVTAHLFVSDAITGKTIATQVLCELHRLDGIKASFMTITPSIEMAAFCLAVVMDAGECRFADDKTVLPPGTYDLQFVVMYAGVDFAKVQQRFTVTVDSVDWTSGATGTKP